VERASLTALGWGLLLMLSWPVAACSTGSIGDPSGSAREGVSSGASGTGVGAGHAGSGTDSSDAGAGPLFEAASPALARLTVAQYQNAVADLFGGLKVDAAELEADTSLEGFTSIGATQVTIAATTAEKYETTALDVAHRTFADTKLRDKLVGCTPSSASAADSCTRKFLASLGKRVWRRPLDTAELDALAQLAGDVGTSLGDPWTGLEYATASLLESPYFLFRVDRGEADPNDATRRRYSSWEMASRLSFLMWQTTPDAELLRAAEADELVSVEGVRKQAQRLAASPRFRPALTRFYSENLQLERLDTLSKDSAVYPQMSPTLPAAMRGELTRAFEHLVFEQDGDVRDLVDAPKTFVNAELAELYGVKMPGSGVDADGFAEVNSPPERRGLLGTAGLLATYANTTSTSPTRRGKFVRTRMLCQEIMPPPPGVVTKLPPAKPNQTMRERLAEHRNNTLCATCHDLMDPIGLGLEHFDGIGAYRDDDHGAMLDVTGDIDGAKFDGAVQLASLLKSEPDLGPCIVRQLYRYATGHEDAAGEKVVLDALSSQLAASGYRLKALTLALVESDGFRYAGEAK
jgi:hypothetical protein